MKIAFRIIILIGLLAAGLTLTRISRAQDATAEITQPAATSTPSPDATAEVTAEATKAAVPQTVSLNGQDMNLFWNDEFDGAAGTLLNDKDWTCQTGGDGWGNNEMEYYTTSASNASMDGSGSLVITARDEKPSNAVCWYGTCSKTSARCNTQGKFEFTYGLVEARIQIPKGQGIWPAFWLLGANINQVGWPNSGELDIMENIGKEPQTIYGTAHGPGYAGQGIGDSHYNAQNYADDYHVFAIDWEADGLTWYVDGKSYFNLTKDDLGKDRWVFDHDFFILLNVAVGGNWPGVPDKTTVFPQTMKVDYVRVYQLAKGS